MEKELKVFKNPEFGQIRVIEQNKGLWFIVADVCRILEIGNPSDAVSRLDSDERTLVSIEGASNGKPVNAVNESGLYTLVLSSRKPEAKKFKRWITHEVIPSIRKYGAYLTPETLEAAILNPDTMIYLCTTLKEEQERNKGLQETNAVLAKEANAMRPKAEYFDELVERNLLTSIRETAKEFSIKEKAFVQFLIEKQYLYRDKKGRLMPYAQYVDKGLFAIKECFNRATEWSGTQTLITPKGRETFRLLCLKRT